MNRLTKKLVKEKLDKIIIDGVNITRQAQEDNASYSIIQFSVLDIHKQFALWRIAVRDFVSMYYPKICSEFFEADSVPDMKGGLEYGYFSSKESQTLLQNIRIETSKKLNLLRLLEKPEKWWEKTSAQVIFLIGAIAGIISLIFLFI